MKKTAASSEPLAFTKMQGLGNDFVVLDATSQPLPLTAAGIKYLADRHLGIGCDQVLLIETATQPGSDFHYRIFNADGSEVAQCGNGARCVARYLYEGGHINRREFILSTQAEPLTVRIELNGEVTVNMGIPRQIAWEKIQTQEKTWELGMLDLGNPHAVLMVPEVTSAPVATIGAFLQQHALFPQQVNVGFMQIVARDHIRLRVYERGAGETLACGSGACAAMVIGYLRDLLASSVTVSLPGGDLTVQWEGPEQPVWMKGPAVEVFRGVWPHPELLF